MKRKEKLSGFWLGFSGLGGYSTKTYEGDKEIMSGYASFVPHEKVLKLARKNKELDLTLGGDWSPTGWHGFGEKVLLRDVRNILNKRKKMGYI